jgi:hypothetical protein
MLNVYDEQNLTLIDCHVEMTSQLNVYVNRFSMPSIQYETYSHKSGSSTKLRCICIDSRHSTMSLLTS